MKLITQDQKMLELVQLAKTVAPSRATILIQGESGTGKEVMAQLIHQESSRAQKPFIAINCAAIPENLLESELFGYERGAFTGAVQSKSGKFELAQGGTLLLDEISEMDIRLQAKLLRVIQEGEVDRIGGRKPVSVDVRIVATTNRNLAECVRSGSFREDLFYRLNVVTLTLPPLKDRLGDVGLLAQSMIEEFSLKNGKARPVLSDEAKSLLEQYGWPGNVRELENVIERAVLTASEGVIRRAHISLTKSDRDLTPVLLQAQSASGASRAPWVPGNTLGDIEKAVILEALQFHSGNRTHTARALGISIRTLRNKLAEYRQEGIFA
jgi:transcriptional regulator with PAS, ATPase and Fis domain